MYLIVLYSIIDGDSGNGNFAVRPVVTITSGIGFTKNGSKVNGVDCWNIAY